MIDLEGKVALVTGGSRGIGRACAVLLAQAGAHVALTYHTHKAEAEKVRAHILNSGRECISLRMDLRSEASIKRAVLAVEKAFGRLDLLVNNAGIWERAPLLNMTSRQWDRTLDTNLKSVFLITRAVIPLMKRQGGGIINIASTAGQRGEPFYSHYAASKGGLIAFTKSIAVELAPHGIRANCIAPGWVDTDMTAPVLHRRKSRTAIERSIPRGTVASPDDVAGAVLFLASDLSNHLLGATLSVNGGGVMA